MSKHIFENPFEDAILGTKNNEPVILCADVNSIPPQYREEYLKIHPEQNNSHVINTEKILNSPKITRILNHDNNNSIEKKPRTKPIYKNIVF